MTDHEKIKSTSEQGLATDVAGMDIEQSSEIEQPLAEIPQEETLADVPEAKVKGRKMTNVEAQYHAYYKEMMTLSAPGADDKSRDEGAKLALWLLEHENIPIKIRVQAHLTRACYGEGDPVWHGQQGVRIMEKALYTLGKFGKAEENLLLNARKALELVLKRRWRLKVQSQTVTKRMKRMKRRSRNPSCQTLISNRKRRWKMSIPSTKGVWQVQIRKEYIKPQGDLPTGDRTNRKK